MCPDVSSLLLPFPGGSHDASLSPFDTRPLARMRCHNLRRQLIPFLYTCRSLVRKVMADGELCLSPTFRHIRSFASSGTIPASELALKQLRVLYAKDVDPRVLGSLGQ